MKNSPLINNLIRINFGSPKEYLKLYHYLLIDYHPAIALEILNKHQMELQGKNDKSFIDSIYKLMRDMLNYKPPITKEQFFATSFAEVKALMACEIIAAIQRKFKLTIFKPHPTAAVGSGVLQSKINENTIKVPNTRVTSTGFPAMNRVISFFPFSKLIITISLTLVTAHTQS